LAAGLQLNAKALAGPMLTCFLIALAIADQPPPELSTEEVRQLRWSVLGKLPPEPAEGRPVENAEYEVMASALRESLRSGPRPKNVVLEPNTVSGGLLLRGTRDAVDSKQADLAKKLQDRLPGLSNEMVQDFLAANAKRTQLTNRFRLPFGVVLLSADLKKRLRTHGYDSEPDKAFRTVFPRSAGTYSLSRVGFSPDRSRAVVYLTWYGDFMAASGTVYVFELKGKTWSKLSEATAWVV